MICTNIYKVSLEGACFVFLVRSKIKSNGFSRKKRRVVELRVLTETTGNSYPPSFPLESWGLETTSFEKSR